MKHRLNWGFNELLRRAAVVIFEALYCYYAVVLDASPRPFVCLFVRAVLVSLCGGLFRYEIV